MNNEGVALVVKRCAADYVKPARLDDALVVETRITHVGVASLELDQTVCRDGQVLVRMDLRIGCFDVATGRPARLPARVRSAFDTSHWDRGPRPEPGRP